MESDKFQELLKGVNQAINIAKMKGSGMPYCPVCGNKMTGRHYCVSCNLSFNITVKTHEQKAQENTT